MESMSSALEGEFLTTGPVLNVVHILIVQPQMSYRLPFIIIYNNYNIYNNILYNI